MAATSCEVPEDEWLVLKLPKSTRKVVADEQSKFVSVTPAQNLRYGGTSAFTLSALLIAAAIPPSWVSGPVASVVGKIYTRT